MKSLALFGGCFAALIASGCALDSTELSPVPTTSTSTTSAIQVKVERIPGGIRLATSTIKVTRRSNVSYTLRSGDTLIGAEELSIESSSGTKTFIKAPEGYTVDVSGTPAAPVQDLAAIADMAAAEGDFTLAGQIELAAEHIPATPVVEDPNDPAPTDPIFVQADPTPAEGDEVNTVQSASRCTQAKNNANYYNAGAYVAWSYQTEWKVLWFGKNRWDAGNSVIGPRTGDCFGRCGKGCDWKWAGTKYTQACVNHDACAGIRGLLNWRCDLIFAPTIWDVGFAPNCF